VEGVKEVPLEKIDVDGIKARLVCNGEVEVSVK
jgi:hypothetical protein